MLENKIFEETQVGVFLKRERDAKVIVTWML